MKIGICDDDMLHCVQLENYILNIAKKFSGFSIDTEVYQSGEELLRILEDDSMRPQILFLDIEMKQMNGIETARKIRTTDQKMIIIYVTSYDKYTMESFDVKPFRYLLKPITDERIEQVFSQAVDEIMNNHTYLFFKRNHEQLQINCEEIISITSEKGRMLRVNMTDKNLEYLFYAKIKDVEKQLNPLVFVKVNQGTIINLNYIHIMTNEEVYLSTGETVIISRGKKKEVKEVYSLYMKRKVGLCQSLK